MNQGLIRAMVERLKESWQEFSESKPNHRFQERYRRR
jgi:hypothetical protein